MPRAAFPPVVLAFAWSISAANLFAATIQVPNPGQGILTLQDGLDAAGPGDIVAIAPGTYRGSFRVANKAGLVIRGKGSDKVFLDARDGALAAAGPGIELVSCDGARIEGLTIQHALATVNDEGVGIAISQSNGVRVSDVRVIDCEEEGLDAEGDDLTLQDAAFSGNGGGVRVLGDRASIEKTRVHGDSVRGILVLGDSASALDCEVGAIRGGSGINLTGEAPTILRCEVTGVFDVDTTGITTTGSNPNLANNLVRGCPIGMYVVYGAFGKVKDNVVEDCYDSGFRTGDASHHLNFQNNVARRCGSKTAAGFRYDGLSHKSKGNRAEDCAGDGFQIFGGGAELIDDSASRCGKDGFDIDAAATGVSLTRCTAKDNRGEGIENSGMNVVLLDNRAKKNRIAFASDGTVMTASGNDFDVAGAPAPEID